MKRKFSHVSYITDYMRIVVKIISTHFGDVSGKTILDMPAGNGWVSEELAKHGAHITPADINEEKPEYAQVDMEKPLPFNDQQFDAIVCAEGIEHILNPAELFKELARVVKPGGIIIITTPNVQSFFSRYQLLCTGYLYLFDPFDKLPFTEKEQRDRGHVSPVFYTQLRYYSEMYGLAVQRPTGSRFKKIYLLPFFLPFILRGYLWALNDWKKTSKDESRKEIINHLFSLRVLFSRSLIFSCVKPVCAE